MRSSTTLSAAVATKPSASAAAKPICGAVHRQHDDVAAEHREGAVGEVDEPHQPHGDRKPDRDDEQHGAGGQSAQQDAGEISDEIHGRSQSRRLEGEWRMTNCGVQQPSYSLFRRFRHSSAQLTSSERTDRSPAPCTGPSRWSISPSFFSCSLPSGPFTTSYEILVHDDVAGLRVDHDRALRAVELPAEQRFHRGVAVHLALGGLHRVDDGGHAVIGRRRR